MCLKQDKINHSAALGLSSSDVQNCVSFPHISGIIFNGLVHHTLNNSIKLMENEQMPLKLNVTTLMFISYIMNGSNSAHCLFLQSGMGV